MGYCNQCLKHDSPVIVPEVLSNDNYEKWSICMKNYLRAQSLWDIVELPNNVRDASWEQKNAAVLHAFQISCAPEIFEKIKEIDNAQEAWSKLAKINELKKKWRFLRSGSQSTEREELAELTQWFQATIPETPGSIARIDCLSLIEAAADTFKGYSHQDVDELLRKHPLAKGARFLRGRITLLTLAASSDNLYMVKKLVGLMSPEELEIKDTQGNTALSYAAVLGNKEVAEVLIKKHTDLLTISDESGMIPVVQACFQRCEDMTKFLYKVTPTALLAPEKGSHGSLLLKYCLQSKWLDIAWHLLHRYPRLAFTKYDKGSTPLLTLASEPSLFRRSGCRKLRFWEWWIYSSSKAKTIDTSREYDYEVSGQPCGWASILPDVFGCRKIHKMKVMHKYANKILDCIMDELRTLSAEEVVDGGIIPAFFQAIQHDIVEFVSKTTPDVMISSVDENSRDMFMHAIEYRKHTFLRHVNLFSNTKPVLFCIRDNDENNLLHMAAKLAPNSYLDSISGPAFKIQRELQWFKEIKSTVPECNELVNHSGETPRQMFTREHENLLKEGEQWLKQTAQSYTIVGSLIVTIMFAAVITVPGGNNQESGFPTFLHEKLFTTFILAVGVALSSSSTSVLMFIGILTSRYAEDDFLKSLPTKLIIGIFTLLVSVSAMMTAFCASVAIMLPGKWRVVISLIFVAAIPVIAFLWLESRFLIEILHSTYGPKIVIRRNFISDIREFLAKEMRKLGRKMKTTRNLPRRADGGRSFIDP